MSNNVTTTSPPNTDFVSNMTAMRDIPAPPTWDLHITMIILGIVLGLLILLALFKARFYLWKCCRKPRRNVLKSKLKSIIRPKTKSSVQHQQSYIDVISCESPLEYTQHLEFLPSRLDVLHSREPSEDPLFLQDNSTKSTKYTSSGGYSSQPTTSEISDVQIERPPFVERAMRVSMRLSRKLFPSFFYSKDMGSRASSKYFYEESQIYSLEHSDKLTTNSSFLSEMANNSELSLFNKINVEDSSGSLQSSFPNNMDDIITISFTPPSPINPDSPRYL